MVQTSKNPRENSELAGTSQHRNLHFNRCSQRDTLGHALFEKSLANAPLEQAPHFLLAIEFTVSGPNNSQFPGAVMA